VELWQRFEPPEAASPPPYGDHYPAVMPDGRVLLLPLRQLPSAPDRAVASMISTQLSFAVERAIVEWLTAIARTLEPDVVVGMPTLGLLYARAIAERLAMSNWVALSTSRKFWYDDALSVPVSSITSPEQSKRLYLDPRMLPRLTDRRVLLVDDVISTGTTAVAGLTLLGLVEAPVVGLLFAMLQGNRWRERLLEHGPAWPPRVRGAFATPLFERRPDGWYPRADTLAPTNVHE
jgi:adenine/guanine phosphoribosyltransferase-like PRPP-binding protein